MLKRLGFDSLPKALEGPILLNALGVPRYWATVWSLLQGSGLAESTHLAKLRAIDELYRHYEVQHGSGAMDLALSRADDRALAAALEGWFTSLSNRPKVSQTAEFRWRTGVSFITDIMSWIVGSGDEPSAIAKARVRWTRLGQLYRNLRVPRPKQSGHIRALPASVIEHLYRILDPTSPDNPFEKTRARWNAYLAFVLMLHQGLRRGELLMMPVDGIKDGYNVQKNRRRYWTTVRDEPYSERFRDPRFSKPSIKTKHSIRSLPVSSVVAQITDTYTNNYRGRPNHPLLLNSYRNTPLSTEALTKMFVRATLSLPDSARSELKQVIGRSVVTCHDLRHTCAVVRLNQMLSRGDAMPDAMLKLRLFFGWSDASSMPLLYTKALFEERLASVWNDALDERVDVIRNADVKRRR